MERDPVNGVVTGSPVTEDHLLKPDIGELVDLDRVFRGDFNRLLHQLVEITHGSFGLAEIHDIHGVDQVDNLGIEIESIKQELSEKTAASETTRTRLKDAQHALETRKKELMQVMTQKVRLQNVFKNAESSRENLSQRIQRTQKDEEELAEKIIKLRKIGC